MIEPTQELVRAAWDEIDFVNDTWESVEAAVKAVLSKLAEQSAVTEYGSAYKSGDVQIWADADEYPIERRIPNHQKLGGIVLTRRVIVLDEWTEVTR